MVFSMTILAVTWLVPIAPAAPSGNVQDVDIMIQQINTTSEIDIVVVGKKTSQILGYACSNTLKSGEFTDLPITATLDKSGAGNLAVGDKTYVKQPRENCFFFELEVIHSGIKGFALTYFNRELRTRKHQ